MTVGQTIKENGGKVAASGGGIVLAVGYRGVSENMSPCLSGDNLLYGSSADIKHAGELSV